jgi:hypothetical protein
LDYIHKVHFLVVNSIGRFGAESFAYYFTVKNIEIQNYDFAWIFSGVKLGPSLILREGTGLTVSENWVLRKTFVPQDGRINRGV